MGKKHGSCNCNNFSREAENPNRFVNIGQPIPNPIKSNIAGNKSGDVDAKLTVHNSYILAITPNKLETKAEIIRDRLFGALPENQQTDSNSIFLQ